MNLVKKYGKWMVEPLDDEDFNAVVGNMVALIELACLKNMDQLE